MGYVITEGFLNFSKPTLSMERYKLIYLEDKESTLNLYKIIFRHHSQKDSKEGMICLVLANNDEEIYEWMKNKIVIGDNTFFISWDDYDKNEDFDDDGELIIRDWKDEETGETITGTYKERIIYFKGCMNDPYEEYCDLYYGKTVYGWELLEEKVDDFYYQPLIKLGLCFDITNKIKE